MKRDIEKANGTYVPDRRGRKRKTLAERWTSTRKRRNISFDHYEDSTKEDYDATEDEDDNDLSKDVGESVINSQANAGGDLSASAVPRVTMRSATTPVLRKPRSKVVPSPLRSNSRFSSTIIPKTSESSPLSDSLYRNLNLPEDPNKRQQTPPESTRTLDELSLKKQMATTCDKPVMLLDKHDFLEILGELMKKGEEQYRDAKLQEAAEKSSFRNVFEASVSRARRMAHEAQDQMKAEGLEYADVLKVKDREQAEELHELKEQLEAVSRSRDLQTQSLVIAENKLENLRASEAQKQKELLELEEKLEKFRESNDQKNAEIQELKQEVKSLSASKDQHHVNEIDALKHDLEAARLAKEAFEMNQRLAHENLMQTLEAQKSTIEGLRVAKENSEREIESLQGSLNVQKEDWERRSCSREQATEALRQELQSSREEAERLKLVPESHSELESLKVLSSRQSARLKILEHQRSQPIHMLDELTKRQGKVCNGMVELRSKHQDLSVSIPLLIKELPDLAMTATTKRLEADLQTLEDIGRYVSMVELGAKEHLAALAAYKLDLMNAEASLDPNGNSDEASHDRVTNDTVPSANGTGDRDLGMDAQRRPQQPDTNGVIDYPSH